MGKSINLLLLDGTVTGPKIATIGNWSGKAFFSPAEKAESIISRPDFSRPGVYILQSDPINDAFSERIYIGESGELNTRLKQHLANYSDQSFNSFLAFSSTDRILNKATVKYLEHKLLEKAIKAKNSEIVNKKTHKTPDLSENDEYTMNHFLSEMQIVLPVMGFNFLQPSALQNYGTKFTPQIVFKIRGRKVKAFMYVREDKIVVMKGSEASPVLSKSISEGWKKVRKKLLLSGILIQEKDSLIFSQDTPFSSPSAASSVVLGRQSAGPIEWRMEDGRSYADWVKDQTVGI